jgi:hypothetical protein
MKAKPRSIAGQLGRIQLLTGACARWDAITAERIILPVDPMPSSVPFTEDGQTCARRLLKAAVAFPEISWGALPADG